MKPFMALISGMFLLVSASVFADHSEKGVDAASAKSINSMPATGAGKLDEDCEG